MPRLVGQIDQAKAEAILDAATTVLSERGLAASIDEIARVAGVSKQTIYNQYGSKTDLIRAIVARKTDEMTAPLRHPDAQVNPQTALATYARSLLMSAGASHKNSVMKVIIQSCGELPEVARAFFESGPRHSRQALANFFVQETQAGRLAVDDPLGAAEFFSGMVMGQRQLRVMITGEAITIQEAEQVSQEAAKRFLRAYAV